MITKELINPESIVVVGGSDDSGKPGGNALKNLIETGFKGNLYVVNPKTDIVQGIQACKSVEELPHVDCAILAIPAKMCPSAVETLCADKGCKAVIIFSAGFHLYSAFAHDFPGVYCWHFACSDYRSLYVNG